MCVAIAKKWLDKQKKSLSTTGGVYLQLLSVRFWDWLVPKPDTLLIYRRRQYTKAHT